MFIDVSTLCVTTACLVVAPFPTMHESMRRLYEAARALKGAEIPAEVARLLGESPQTIKNWEGRGISKDGLLKAQTTIGCLADWVRDGAGTMTSLPGTQPARRIKTSPAEILIPQYDTGGAGGLGLVLKDQPGIIQNLSVSQDWLRANVPYCTSPGNLCVVTGFGDSMPDMFSPGDPVLVDRGVTSCDHDGVYFFRVENEGFIKRLQRIPGDGIRVISQNKEYETWTIRPDMDFEVFGKVLKAWKGRNY